MLSVRPKVAELSFQLFGRALHPELFEVHKSRVVERGEFVARLDITTAGHSGCSGGAGCSGTGSVATSQGGGGGGGGVCQGMTTQTGAGRAAYDPKSELASGAALGGDGKVDCDPGGDGYAIVSFTR